MHVDETYIHYEIIFNFSIRRKPTRSFMNALLRSIIARFLHT